MAVHDAGKTSILKVDEILEKVGPFNKYQFIQLIWIGLPSLTIALQVMIVVFHNIIPDHRCSIPGWSNDTYSVTSAAQNASVYQSIPLMTDGSLNSCEILQGNQTTTSCQSHLFDTAGYGGETVVSKFDVVCENAGLNTASKVGFTAGLLIGALGGGFAADFIGRKWAILLYMLIGSTFALISMFSVNIYMYAALRFCIALFYVGCFTACHALAIEITGPSRRVYMQCIKAMFWPMGMLILGLMAYLIRDWNWLQFAITIPCFITVVLLAIFMKPSPQWLISRGRHTEAVKIFKEMALINGKQIPENLMESVQVQQQSAEKEKLISIFKARTLLMRSCILFYLWFMAALGYYGLSLGVGNLAGSIYVNHLISGAVELPVGLAAIVSGILGRKKPFIFLKFIGAAALIASAFMTVYLDRSVYGGAVVGVSMVGKFAVSVIFNFCYFWGSEMFPTTLRTSLTGICSACSRAGVFLAPVIADLHLYVDTYFGEGISYLIYGLGMTIGGFLALALPETNGIPVPQTIAEADVFQTKREHSDYKDNKSAYTNNEDAMDDTALAIM